MLKLYSGLMKKKKLNKENVFVALSIVFLLGSILFYGGRLIYFYNLENKTEEEVVTNLNDVLISEEVFSGDGLYKVDDVWQIPPPTSCTTLPSAYAPASLYPSLIVLSPTV